MYKVALLGSLETAALCSMRVTISIAIVSMVEQKPVVDPNPYNQRCSKPARVSWQVPAMKSLTGQDLWNTYVLTASLYGYLISQIPGAYLSSIIGGEAVFGYATLIRSVLFMLNPPIAFLGVQWLILSNVLEGALAGLTPTAVNHVVARWASNLERS